MRNASRLLVVALALLGVAGLLISSSGAAADGPTAVEYGKKAKKKKKKAIKKATKALRDGQYVGARGDGELVDWTFCKNGKYYMESTGYYGTGISKGKGWKIGKAKQTKRGWWAILNGKGGLSVAMAKYGKQWKVGISSFDMPTELGNVKRTNARKLCKTL